MTDIDIYLQLLDQLIVYTITQSPSISSLIEFIY